jgi:hypothetical protein
MRTYRINQRPYRPHGIFTEELRAGSGRTRVSQARALIAARCVRQLGAPAAEIAADRGQHFVGEPGDNEDGRRGSKTLMHARNQRP